MSSIFMFSIPNTTRFGDGQPGRLFRSRTAGGNNGPPQAGMPGEPAVAFSGAASRAGRPVFRFEIASRLPCLTFDRVFIDS